MLSMLALSLLLMLPAPVFSRLGSELAYPSNPNVQDDFFFVAGRGIARYQSATSEPVWSALPGKLLREPLVAGPRLLIGGSRSLYALDSVSGRLLWQYRFPDPFFNPVLVYDRLIVTDANGVVRALSVDTGDLLWEAKKAQGWLYPPAVVEDLLITGGQARVLIAFDAKTGTSKWQRKLDQELVYSPLATAGGGIVVTTFSGGVFMLRANDGSELWNSRFDTPSLFPSIVDHRLLLSEMDGTLRALDPDSGEMIWQQTLSAPLVAPVNGRGELLLATVGGGRIFILDSNSGEILKRYRLGAEAIGSAQFLGDRIVAVTEGRNGFDPVPVYLEEFPGRD